MRETKSEFGPIKGFDVCCVWTGRDWRDCCCCCWDLQSLSRRRQRNVFFFFSTKAAMKKQKKNLYDEKERANDLHIWFCFVLFFWQKKESKKKIFFLFFFLFFNLTMRFVMVWPKKFLQQHTARRESATRMSCDMGKTLQRGAVCLLRDFIDKTRLRKSWPVKFENSSFEKFFNFYPSLFFFFYDFDLFFWFRNSTTTTKQSQ